ncbi:MAG: radical SAM protein [bacterium]|nr:radical SAM protein [bacterium]
MSSYISVKKKYLPAGFMVQWHITPKCDQSCLHCYIMGNPELYKQELTSELSLSDCKKIIDSIIDFCRIANAYPAINFTGGDPLLRPDFFEILEYSALKGVSLGVMGNPFHLSPEIIKKMKNLNIKDYQVSIDGMEKNHDWMRKPGSFFATVEAIKLLKKYGMRSVVMFTLNKNNAQDILSVMELVSGLGVDVFSFARLSRDLNKDKRLSAIETEFSPAEYRQLLLDIQKKSEELKTSGSKTKFSKKDHLWKLLLYEQGKFQLEPNPKSQIISGCHIGRCNLTILGDGTVFACRRFNSPIGKMPKQSALEVFTSDKLNFYRQIDKFEKCSRCQLLNYCRGCPAVAFGASGGNFYAPDPQCWKVD